MADRSERLRVVRVDPDILSLARAYLANRAKDLDTIRQALSDRDYATIHGIGHNLHGSGQMFGFVELTALGARLQRAAEVEDAADIARVEGCLDDYLARTRVEGAIPERQPEAVDSAGPQPAGEDSMPPEGQYLLVVDDEATNRLLIAHHLRVAGYRVREASDGEEALAAVRQRPPALVLLDVVMPGASGFEVCQRLKQSPATAAIPVVLLTALDRNADRAIGMQAGADDFVTKPVSRAELLSRVSLLVASGG
jgi:CheY-like chemotaxis protein/HPt (histidine-containing phosphotransfer) domain-containing protein